MAEAFAKAAHVTKLKPISNRIVVNAMEPRAAVGSFDGKSGRYTLTLGCQGVWGLRANLAPVLGVAPDKLHVLSHNVGGSFGMKSQVFPEYPCVLFAARALSRPVKWTDERSGSFVSDNHGRDHEMEAELALDKDGRILALRLTGFGNAGAYPIAPLPYSVNAVKNVVGVYRTPLLRGDLEGRLYQHAAGRPLSRRRAARGQLLHGAADGRGRRRDGHRPARDPAAQLHPARGDAVQGAVGLVL